ncbi:hypothetical protein, partial [Klebsiella pneumoniae]|uniref:hypothetical protein n=1 Tax=Klebsiella pneumoniae TaxID=573 RepID=UPI0025A1337A
RDEATAAVEANELLSPEAKDLARKQLACAAARAVFVVLEPQLLELADRRLPPKAGPVRALHALLFTLLYDKAAFVEAPTRKVRACCAVRP